MCVPWFACQNKFPEVGKKTSRFPARKCCLIDSNLKFLVSKFVGLQVNEAHALVLINKVKVKQKNLSLN
jgi:hypothetical protein